MAVRIQVPSCLYGTALQDTNTCLTGMTCALLAGPSQSLLGYLGPAGLKLPEEQYYVMCWRFQRQVVLKHMMAAHSQRKSLRAYLEDLAGFRKGGW